MIFNNFFKGNISVLLIKTRQIVYFVDLCAFFAIFAVNGFI